ncbi:MAG: hypothetical protein N2Z23_00540 [Pyrinomonadaceae bacterium]|nr:hypothetical protein [Pyrinomonadaceae bacterium]MCX7638921.1 hypothetical protein [Pyrinomonadaceae bacterium]MDW8304942.1 hypothetical protein [Acidobacteriota bacterium]
MREIFQDYEIKGWSFSNDLYKVFIISVMIHILFLVALSQIDLFGTKACDSPYINKVCQVLETAYVAGNVLLGTDVEFSSREYAKTEIPEEYDVTFIDVGEQFTYPPGYFETVRAYDPESSTNDVLQTDNSSLDINKPQTLPTPNPNPVVGNLPEPPKLSNGIKDSFVKRKRVPNRPFSDVIEEKPSPTITANANLNQNTAPVVSQTQDANETVTQSGLEPQKLFNKKPLEDFGFKYGQAILDKELDLNAPFEIEVKAGLDEYGKLVKPTMTVKQGSDPKMVELAKEAISAFSDSQLLLTLYNAGVKSVTIKFAQDKDHLQAIITSDAGTPNRASAIQSSVNIAIRAALSNMNPESDEAKLISKTEITTQGSFFIVNFLIPHNEKVEMIEKNLRSLQEKLKKVSEISEAIGKEKVR